MTVQTTSPEAPPSTRTSSLAVVALVAGILAWTFAPFLGAIVAIITGSMARNEIRTSGGELTGDGFAVAGLILGWVGLLFSFCGFCFLGLCLPFSICGAILGSTPDFYGTIPLLGVLF